MEQDEQTRVPDPVPLPAHFPTAPVDCKHRITPVDVPASDVNVRVPETFAVVVLNVVAAIVANVAVPATTRAPFTLNDVKLVAITEGARN